MAVVTPLPCHIETAHPTETKLGTVDNDVEMAGPTKFHQARSDQSHTHTHTGAWGQSYSVTRRDILFCQYLYLSDTDPDRY